MSQDAHPGDRLVRQDQLLSVISVAVLFFFLFLFFFCFFFFAFFFMGENVCLVYFLILVDVQLC